MARLYKLTLLLGILAAASADPAANFARESGKFSMDLYGTILKGNQKSLVISPVSVQTALGLAYFGANGDTAKEMSSVLRLDQSESVVVENFKTLLDSHASSGELKIANKMVLDTTFGVKPEFSKLASTSFSTSVDNVDTSDGKRTADFVNSWVEAATNSKIKDLVTANDVQDAKAVIVNAVYFKANWTQPFPPINNAESDFWVTRSDSKKVTLMSRTSDYELGVFDGYSVLKLDYRDTDISLLVALPNERDGLSSVESRLVGPNTDVKDILAKLQRRSVFASIPKFKTEFSVDLETTLRQMGVNLMFDDEADFSKISDLKLKIKKILHKAVLQVDEFGTEAAAATDLVFINRIAHVNPFNFIADHPFLYLLVDPTGHIYFMGRFVG